MVLLAKSDTGIREIIFLQVQGSNSGRLLSLCSERITGLIDDVADATEHHYMKHAQGFRL